MLDETSTPPDSTSLPQAADTQAPPSEPVTPSVTEPLQQSSGQAASPAPTEEPKPVDENPPAPQTEPPPLGKEELENAPQAQDTPHEDNTTLVYDHPSSTEEGKIGVGELLVKARAKIQERRRKKLEKIMEALDGRGPTSLKLRRVNKISNDDVQKMLRVSDATATRYLDILEKEGRIRQEGKTGKNVVYVKT